MKHLFVSFKTAKALKELGFDEPCFGRWINGEFADYKCESQHLYSGSALAPTHQQTTDWFREKHEIIVESRTEYSEDHQRSFVPYIDNKDGFIEGEYCTDYYAALNAAIDEAIKLITK